MKKKTEKNRQEDKLKKITKKEKALEKEEKKEKLKLFIN